MTLSIILTAAGSGSRFGSQNGKMFVEFQGKPLILHSFNALSKISFQEFIITIEEEKIDLLKKLNLPPNIQIIPGGPTRKESVQFAFNQLKPVDKVLIHDGARPNLKPNLLNRLIEASQNHSAIIPGIPVTDTIKQIDANNFVQNTPPRKSLVQIQTPQIFDYSLLKRAYQKIHESEITDEAMLIEHLNEKIKVIEGDPKNLKITYPIDLQFLNLLA